MNRERISRIAHADHPIAAPVGDDSVRRLLERGIPHGDARILDLGCGGGEWLLRALTMHPRLRAEGVDISEGSLAHARTAARGLGVQERLTLHHEDAAEFTAPHAFDLVLIGKHPDHARQMLSEHDQQLADHGQRPRDDATEKTSGAPTGPHERSHDAG